MFGVKKTPSAETNISSFWEILSRYFATYAVSALEPPVNCIIRKWETSLDNCCVFLHYLVHCQL